MHKNSVKLESLESSGCRGGLREAITLSLDSWQNQKRNYSFLWSLPPLHYGINVVSCNGGRRQNRIGLLFTFCYKWHCLNVWGCVAAAWLRFCLRPQSDTFTRSSAASFHHRAARQGETFFLWVMFELENVVIDILFWLTCSNLKKNKKQREEVWLLQKALQQVILLQKSAVFIIWDFKKTWNETRWW